MADNVCIRQKASRKDCERDFGVIPSTFNCYRDFKNMRHIFLAMVLATSVLVAPASANDGTNKTAASDPDQSIKCRKVEVTGSLLKKGRVCRTIAEWKKIQANGNRTARAIIESGNVCAGGSCGNGQ